MIRNNILTMSLAGAFFLISVICPGQNLCSFDSGLLRDSTLRVDYIFSGTDSSAVIALDRMSCSEGWYGRRVNMERVPVRGNGQITMRDAATGMVLYRNSFSTLFQEWQTTEEATRLCKSFENVYLLPMPSRLAEITVELFDVKGRRTASMTHGVDPADILIRCPSPVLSASGVAPHRYIHIGGSSDECIDVAVVAEGYTEDEAELFYSDARAAADALFSYEPFSRYMHMFNIVAVALPSTDSGVSVPLEGEWKDTPLHSHFRGILRPSI